MVVITATPTEQSGGLTKTASSEISISTDIIVIKINVNTETKIDAFGFLCKYPADLLTFIRTETTDTLTEGWIASRGQENENGHVRIGGFNTEPITELGVLIKIVFGVDKPGTGEIELSELVDDLAGFVVKDKTVGL